MTAETDHWLAKCAQNNQTEFNNQEVFSREWTCRSNTITGRLFRCLGKEEAPERLFEVFLAHHISMEAIAIWKPCNVTKAKLKVLNFFSKISFDKIRVLFYQSYPVFIALKMKIEKELEQNQSSFQDEINDFLNAEDRRFKKQIRILHYMRSPNFDFLTLDQFVTKELEQISPGARAFIEKSIGKERIQWFSGFMYPVPSIIRKKIFDRAFDLVLVNLQPALASEKDEGAD